MLAVCTTCNLLALTEERVLGEGLLEVVPPCRQVGICVSLEIPIAQRMTIEGNFNHKKQNVLVDVSGSRIVIGITTIANMVRILIHTNPIDTHDNREHQMLQVDLSEIRRHTQIGNDIQRFLRDGSWTNLDSSICCHSSLLECPSHFAIRDPSNVLFPIM